MQSISIQIQPEHVAAFDQKRFLSQVRDVGRSPEIDAFDEKGNHFLQFHFFTEFPKKLWQDLQAALYKNADYSAIISPISITIYEDETQPQSFLVLHHFDPTEKIDHL